MRIPPLPADFIYTRICKPICAKFLTLPNSVMENFFGLLKSELLYLQEFESVGHFKKELIEYLSWYNEKRIKVKLKGLTPLQTRNQSLKSAC